MTCERGTQKRFLKCAEKYVSGKYRELASKKCSHLPKPSLELERACAPLPCPRHPPFAAAGPSRSSWFASPWSQVGEALRSWRVGEHSLAWGWPLAPGDASARVFSPKLAKLLHEVFFPEHVRVAWFLGVGVAF